MPKAVDYSWARPTPQSLRAEGYDIAVRYLSYEPGKNLSIGERDALWAAGIAIGLVWETTATRPLAGWSAGEADAREANRQASALDFPVHQAIYYGVDFNATIQQIDGPISDYLHGVNNIGGRPRGVYGHYEVIERLVGRGLVPHGWQCAAWSGSGWGSGGQIQSGYTNPVRLSRHACLFQHYGLTGPFGDSIDHNAVIMDPSPWAYHPDQQPPEEDDMGAAKIISTKANSAWARDVAGRAPGDEKASYIFWPGGTITWIRNPEQLAAAKLVLEDAGEHDDVWFWNGYFQPADGRVPPVNTSAVATAVVATVTSYLANHGTAVEITAAMRAQLADEVVDVLHERLKSPAPAPD